MKRIAIVAAVLVVAASSASAGDYVKLMKFHGEEVFADATDIWQFRVERTCPDPLMIYGVTITYLITASGNATWDFQNGFAADSIANSWFNLGGLLFTDGLSGTDMTFGMMLCGGAAMPPDGGLPITNEVDIFSLEFTYGTGFPGEMCIDSAFIFTPSSWRFSGLTCGLGGRPDRPLFLDGSGSDDHHPICITVVENPATYPSITNCPSAPLSESHCDPLTYQFEVDPGMVGSDPSEIDHWYMVSGVGTINPLNGYYTAVPMPIGTYPVTVGVMNDHGLTSECSFEIEFTNSAPVITNCPTQNIIVHRPGTASWTFTASDPDPCDGLVFWLAGNSAPDGVVRMETDGSFSWQTTTTTPGGIYSFAVIVEDGEGGQDVCQFCVELGCCDPFFLYIEKLEDVYQGCFAYPGIWLVKGAEFFGGFDFLIAYDASAMTFMSAQLGSYLDGDTDLNPMTPDVNGWEYFTYRYNWNGNCGGSCPSGLLRVVGIADINNGPNHPDVLTLRHPGGLVDVQLVQLTFYVTNDRTYECMYAPIRFFWDDCGDNALSSPGGDTLYISRLVYDIEWNDITGDIHYGGHTWLGDCMNPDPDKPDAFPFIDFKHGGLDIICADSIDARGDINLNDIDNEIADAVLFTNYFIYGLYVFDINTQGQIAATDVNNDGRVLTVGDLVYLVRIITGDALPFPKLSPFSNTVDIIEGDAIIAKSPVNIGAALFVFDGETDARLLVDGMKMVTDVVDNQTRVLVWSDSRQHIAAGNTEILATSGSLVEASVSDYYGNEMNVNLQRGQKPSSFALMQNYPNPFNPSTDITIKLPTASDYRIDIYNIAGQLVKRFSGYGVGNVTVTWNAVDAASGVYFYKATAGDFTATRKMVLMK